MSDTRWQGAGLIVAGCLVAVGVGLSGPPRATPGFAVTLAATTPSGSSTTLSYHASVSPADVITRGDYFRVNDVAGYVAGSAAAPRGWSAAVEPGKPSGGFGHDDPAVGTLVFTYAGSEPIVGPVLLKGFSARTTSGKPRAVRAFVGRTTRAGGPDEGKPVSTAGDVHGPGAVPEPASVVSGTVGVLILGVVYACRHRRKLRGSA